MNSRFPVIAMFFAVCGSTAVAAQQRAALRVTPVATFGCDDCNGPTQFSRIQAVSIVDATHVLVADAANPRLRLFTTQGVAVKSYGQSGKGPGEIGSVAAIAGDVGGGAQVFDLGQGRISYVRDTGKERTTVTTGGFITTAVIAPGGKRAVFATTRSSDTGLSLQHLVDGKAAPAFKVIPAMFPLRHPQIASVAVAVSDEGAIAVGDGAGAYRIDVFTATGDRTASITRPTPKARKTQDEMQAEAQGTNRIMGEVASMAMAHSGGKARPKVTKVDVSGVEPLKDYFDTDALHFDSDGNLWVHVKRGASGTSVFDVFDSARKYLGEVTLKGDVRFFDVSHGVIAAVVTDAGSGVEQISVWRVDK